MFFGAGSAGIGVAKQLTSFFKFMGMSEEEAKKQIWVSIVTRLETRVVPVRSYANDNMYGRVRRWTRKD